MGIIVEGGLPSLLRFEQRESVRAVVLSVGLAHETAHWLMRRLRAIGYDVEGVIRVDAVRSAIEGVLANALAMSDLVVVVGGIELGSAPTFEAVASLLGRPLVEDEEAKRMVEEYYRVYAGEGSGAPPPGYHVFYNLPEGSMVIRNQRGPAPGIFIDDNGKYLLCVPKDPIEVSIMVRKRQNSTLESCLGFATRRPSTL